ncbi:eukaryotic translation initiation factor 4E type 2 isoform X2 [Histomonas meleagridis]|uniref:eukaryotic translation initiation factor 4E type 2 isoform X2 n=1 Tax=Histomonas meleagridis TaxID=135588 RepID=UPI003559D82E|nr:eukaryotic translation initiation factor 4E type 2 isoform X2 [Histomonas meleagridis]KAH0800933.1 eukaryotic translation initiation factor 4E type 2 isoform X2 [Histomonas meleagridis]
MSHPLNSSWTLYFQRQDDDIPDIPGGYASSIHKIGKFDTIEGFWSYYSHLKRPSEIDGKLEFQIFRNDIRGMWEDEENLNGGRWFFFVNNKNVSQLWERTLLALIGEQIHEDVVGAVMAIKEGTDIFSFWTKSGHTNSSEQFIMDIAESISKAINLPPGTHMKFKQHVVHGRTQNRPLFSYTVGEPKTKRVKKAPQARKFY